MTYKYFIAAVTALAISVTGLTAAPARAGDDTAKILTGLAAIAIVGAAISSSKKDDDYAYVSRSHGHKPKYYGYSSHRKHHYKAHKRHHKAHKRHHKAFKHHRKHKRHHFKKRYHRW